MDSKLIVIRFNECINNHDLKGLGQLMSDDHTFIDREGIVHQSKQVMIENWKEFFRMFPDYRNTFNRMDASDGFVAILGFAYWSAEQPYDPVIWTATVKKDRVCEWRIYDDTQENRRRFNLV